MANNGTQVSTAPPLYAKLSIIIIGIVAFCYILYIGRSIIVPLVFSLLIAILLNPLVNRLCKLGVNRVLAITIAVLSTILFFVALIAFISWQATMFSDSFTNMQGKLQELYNQALEWITSSFKLNKEQVNGWFGKMRTQISSNAGSMIGQSLGVLGGLLVFIFLLPVYIFIILYYKPLLLNFIAKLFAPEKHKDVVEVLGETKVLIQSYLIGLLMDMAIVATLNATGLLIIGVQYAILIGLIGSFLNLIPYIGGIVAVAIPIFITLTTDSDPFTNMLLIIALYSVVQFIDNNLIMPRIVASKVKLNVLASIVVVLIGNALWGIPGMFLSIPLTAIIKVIFDRINSLEPWGYLLGDDMPAFTKQIFRIGRRRVQKES
jgi:predicted PurR-regulated permease PerM